MTSAFRFLESREAHPIRWQLIDLAVGTAGAAAVWIVIGRVAGIIAASVWGTLTVLGLAALMAKRRRRRHYERRTPS